MPCIIAQTFLLLFRELLYSLHAAPVFSMINIIPLALINSFNSSLTLIRPEAPVPIIRISGFSATRSLISSIVMLWPFLPT